MLVKRFFQFIFALIMWTLEIILRLLWLMIPVGLHILFLQLRKKVDKLPAMTGYFNPDSTWHMIYDGVVLVNTNPGAIYTRVDNIKKWFVKTKWYWLVLAVMVLLGSLVYIAYKLH